MAEIKISELTANGANLQTTDRIPTAVDDGLGGFVTRYVTGDEVIGAVSKATVPVRNQSGATIYKGTIVYISSAAGNKLLISKSLANSDATSARTLGVVTADIPNNSNGNVQSSGILTNLDTRSSATHPFTSVTLAEGDTLYLDPTTAGYITNVKPLAPSHLVYIGKVINASPTTGEILYQIQNGFELYEIHDVAITSVANNDVLQYDSATSLWKNETLSNAGIQATLVSGTSIKTINSTSILGSGDIAISSGLTVGTTAITSGTIGRILFQNSSNTLGQESNFFWDNTNKRLGIGTSTPLDKLNIYTATGNNGMVLSCSVGNANVISFKNLDATSQGSFLATGSSFNPYGTYQSSQVNLAGSAGGVGIRTTNGANSHIRFYTGNADSDFSTEKIRIASTTGNLLINTTTDSGVKLDVKAGGALSTDLAFRIRNSADTLDIIRANGLGEVYIGIGAGSVNTATQNTFIGLNAGLSNTTGAQNTVNGYHALRTNSTGQSNTANGAYALFSNTTGNNNIGIGYASLYLNTTAASNTAIGHSALYSNTTGSNNSALGFYALQNNTTAAHNSALGFYALQSNTTGQSNAAIGSSSLFNNTTGGSNTAIGYASGAFIAGGVTGNTITTNSVYIGNNTKALANNQTNQIVIGDNATGAGSNTVTLGHTTIVKTILRGTINAANLPTSPAGLVTGDIWNNLGILTIV